jgi:imidazolonepropionase
MNEGVTTLEIKSGYGLNAEAEEKMLQVARQLSLNNPVDISPTLLAAHAVPPEYRQDPDAYLTLVCEQICPRCGKKSCLKRSTCFVKTSALPRRKPSASSRPRRAGYSGERARRAAVESGRRGAGQPYKGLSADHIEYLDDAGVQAMAQSGTVAVLLPGAFYFLQERQRPPVEQLRKQGVPMAVATDYNPGTSPFASLHLAMNMACVQFGLTPEEAWAGVTRHAAQALGRGATHGQLQAGLWLILSSGMRTIR